MSTHRLYFRSLTSALLLLIWGGIAQARDIQIVGTGDGMDVLKAISNSYSEANPGMNFLVPPSIGSGGGIAAVGANREVIGRVARPLTSNEASSGIHYQPVFYLPSAFFVHPEIPVRSLTGAQLKAIFSGEIISWKDVGGPDVRIRVVRREDADSSVIVFRASIPEFRDIKFTERSKYALTNQEAIDSIKENPGAIGFGSYSTSVAKGLGTIAVGGVKPTEKSYPANVILALIFKPDQLDNDIRRYIAYFNDKAAHDIMRASGARPFEP